MSGLLILLASTFLFDEPLPAPARARSAPRVTAQQGETLPAPRKPSTATETTKLISSTTQPPASPPVIPSVPTQAEIGWGVDPSDNSMYMVIQIAPSAIETFAAGQRGQELTSRIPPSLRNRIDKVIVRFGTGPVEKFPSESELATMPLAKNTTPQITNLDRRNLVNIDAPRSDDIVPTSSTTQIPITPNAVLPSTALPNTVATAPSVPAQPPAWNNNVPSTRPAGTVATTDSFAPSNRVVPQSLLPFGSTRPATTYPTPTQAQGNVTYSGTNTSGNNYGNNPYSNPPYGNMQYGTNALGSNVPMMASNPNTGVYPPVNEPVLPNGIPNNGIPNNGSLNPTGAQPNFFNANPNLQSNPTYGLPVSTSNPTYATNGSLSPGAVQHSQGPILPPPNLLPSTSSTNNGGNAWRLPSRNDQEVAQDVLNSTRPGSWVPFFLVLSFILNVYFGLWLNHLSTKYRYLLANVRGLSASDLERA